MTSLLSFVLKALSRKPFAVVGHRGAKGLAPENTLEALEKAVEAGADIAEFDVQRTSDGVLVASHDPVIEVSGGGKLDIRSTPWSIVSRVERIDGGRVPALRDVIEDARGRIPLFLEVKEPSDTRVLVELVRNLQASKWVAIISFHKEAVETAKRLAPDIPVGLIYYKPPGAILECKRLRCEIVLPRYPLATPRAVSFAHRLGLKVVVWTVNDEGKMVEYARRGVDGIATDRPDIASKVRDSLARGGVSSAKGGSPH